MSNDRSLHKRTNRNLAFFQQRRKNRKYTKCLDYKPYPKIAQLIELGGSELHNENKIQFLSFFFTRCVDSLYLCVIHFRVMDLYLKDRATEERDFCSLISR